MREQAHGRQQLHGLAANELTHLTLITFSGDGRVLQANPRGEALLREQTQLRVRRGRLRAIGPGEVPLLEQAVHAVGRHGLPRNLNLAARDASTQACMTVMRAPEGSTHASGAGLRLLCVATQGKPRIATVHQLMEWFGLTPAEAQLAASAMASGRLDTGALKITIDSSKSTEVAGRGSAAATLVETLVFRRSGASSSSPTRVSFSLDVSGRIYDSGYESPSPGIGAFLNVAYKLHPNGGSYSGSSDSVLFSGSGEYRDFLFADFEMYEYAEVLLQVALQSPVNSLGVAAGGSSIDFGHSAYVAVVTSPDVSWTSGSGVFLTAAARVPEPATTGLLALSLSLLALRVRRRDPAA